MKNITRTIKLQNRITDLDKIKGIVVEVTGSLPCTKRVFKEIDLVLEELFVNVVNHGFSDDTPHEIKLTLGCEDDGITIQMEDDGRPFDMTQAPPSDTDIPIEERKVGGLGIQMVKHFTDQCDYRRENGKNIVRVKKTVTTNCTNKPS